MSEWERTTLGKCFTLVKRKASPGDLPSDLAYVGMEHIDPGMPTVTRTATAGEVASAVGLFEPGDVLFGRLRAYLRKVALADFAGCASTEVLILRPVKDVCLPGFLHLMASSDGCIEHAVAASAGSRMPRTSVADLSAYEVHLPSVAEQRRIVDVMAAVDAQIKALEAESNAAAIGRARVFGSACTSTRSVEDVAVVSQGRALAKDVQGTVSGEISWFKIADMTGAANTFGYTVAETRMTEAEVLARRGAVVAQGAVVMPRVGAAVLTEKKRIMDVTGAVDENHLIATPTDVAHAEVLLAAFESIALASLVQTGAVPSLNMGLLRSLDLPWPGEGVSGLNDALRGLRQAARARAMELVHLRTFRATLLTALLSQHIEIPGSYDTFFEDAVEVSV